MTININAPLNNLSYGLASFNIVEEIIKRGIDLCIFPIGRPDISSTYKHLIYNNHLNFNRRAPSIRIFHQDNLFEHVGGGTNIGFPIFELNMFSGLEKASMNSCDHLFMCSEWAKEVARENKIKPGVTVVPLGVDNDLFQPSSIQRKDKTIFFNVGKWEYRKGHDVLLECFNSAFNPNDNVELWMLSDNIFIPEVSREWERRYKESKLGDKIRILPRLTNQSNVYNIMKQVDCGVFPSRAEGWNLGLLELMACGKHVITTNYSGHTEFCNKSNSFLIDVDSLEVANDGIWFKGNGMWAHLGGNQKENLVYYMREFHKKKNENPNLILQNSSGIITAQQFTWKNTVDKILSYLKIVGE